MLQLLASWENKTEWNFSTHKILFHKLQLVVLAVFAFLVRELVLVRGALAGMKVAIALPVPNLSVPVASYPFGVASLVVVAVLGAPGRAMPAGCFFPAWAPRKPTVPSFGHPRVHRVMPQEQRGLLPSISLRETNILCQILNKCVWQVEFCKLTCDHLQPSLSDEHCLKKKSNIYLLLNKLLISFLCYTSTKVETFATLSETLFYARQFIL